MWHRSNCIWLTSTKDLQRFEVHLNWHFDLRSQDELVSTCTQTFIRRSWTVCVSSRLRNDSLRIPLLMPT